MARRQDHGGPRPITDSDRTLRVRRIRNIARRLGFLGRVEYQHVISGTGGAQFGLGVTPDLDLIVVYAEAFLRDADPNDFSLEAILAHERGHQFVLRNKRLQKLLSGRQALATEEILASLIGSMLVEKELDREALVLKALDDAVQCGLIITEAVELITQLRQLLGELL